MGRALFDIWAAVCPRRVEFNRWEWAPQRHLQRNKNPNPRIFCFAVARNIDRAHRRRMRAICSPLSVTHGSIALEAKAALQAPSEDKMIPEVQQGPPLT